ncbi:hypothetical protein DID74_01530 [Candidatus Marinamargulisbacteria bacterium SCGC AG-333-B06]|nr:hypothetical protein DID74_01530 [Candidatus Marinamargulisbacteria bacterium SCGC AG-333-B06]
MKNFITQLIIIAIILIQPYLVYAYPDNTTAQVRGYVSYLNSLQSISYSTNSTSTDHAIVYEISNNSPNGYEVHVLFHSADATITVTKDIYPHGFWGNNNVSFIKSIPHSTTQRYSAILDFVTKATYQARFKINIVSNNALSLAEIQNLLAINVIQY